MATQRTKIYLEGVELDLDKNVDIDFTYSIADIADFEKRTTTFSKTVSIPGTAHNNFLFGNYFDFNIANDFEESLDNVGVNFNPLKKAFVKVTLDNVEVFAGVLRLLEITSIDGVLTYQCALFGSLGGLFSTLGESLLTDLDLSDLDHTYNWATIKGTWTEANPSYVYPMANYGLGINALENQYSVLNFRPAITVKELFNRIVSNAGYSYNTDLWDNNNLDKLIVLNSEDIFSVYADQYGNAKITEDVYEFGDWVNLFDYSFTGLTYEPMAYPLSYHVRNTSGITLNIKFEYDLNLKSNLPVGAFASLTTNIRQPDTTAIATQASTVVLTGTGVEFTENVKFSQVLTLEPNQKFDIVLSPFFEFPEDIGSVTILSGSTLKLLSTVVGKKIPAIYNSPVSGRSIVPDNIKQSDFLKSIINLLNLYIIQDRDNEFNLTFLPYPDFYLNESIDWTDKKDIQKGFSIKSSNDFIPRNYVLNYKEDQDYYSKLYKNKYGIGYGNKKVGTENEFSKDDKQIEVILSLCPIISSINNDRILSAMYDINTDGTYKQIKTNPKLAFWGGQKDCESYTVKYVDSTIATETVYGYAGHIYDPLLIEDGSLWDVCFESPIEVYYSGVAYPTENLFTKYYQQFIQSQNSKDSKLLTLYFLLNSVDIMNLDFQKLIKLDNGLYYLNKVDGYNPLGNDLTKVELLRIA